MNKTLIVMTVTRFRKMRPALTFSEARSWAEKLTYCNIGAHLRPNTKMDGLGPLVSWDKLLEF